MCDDVITASALLMERMPSSVWLLQSPCSRQLECGSLSMSLVCAASPLMTHYGWDMRMPQSDFVWFKHYFVNHDGTRCPPWRLTPNSTLGGLFPHPVYPTLLLSQARPPTALQPKVVRCSRSRPHCRPAQCCGGGRRDPDALPPAMPCARACMRAQSHA